MQRITLYRAPREVGFTCQKAGSVCGGGGGGSTRALFLRGFTSVNSTLTHSDANAAPSSAADMASQSRSSRSSAAASDAAERTSTPPTATTR
jgi:hypothetical protein